jgi:two-component system, cell cycle sensor histidine kinase and response regulator CckA
VAGSPSGQGEATCITEALQALERDHESLFGFHPDAIFALDLDGRVLTVNAALEMLTGRESRDLTGNSFIDFIPPDDQERVWRHFQRAAHGEAQSFETGGVSMEGREFTLATTLVPTRVHGVIEGVHGVGRDITRERDTDRALRDVQERYDLLAENAQDMISLHDPAGNFLFASPAAWTLLGYHPVELTGRSVYDLVEPEDVPALRTAHETIMQRAGRGPSAFRARRRDGTVRWLEATARMVTHPETGAPWRIVGVTRDVSERRAFEEHLMQSQKLEALGRLAGGIAHDFNNALTVIGGHAELLTKRLGNTPERKAAEYIREAALRASALTSQLLSFGRNTPGPRVLDVNAVLLDMQPLLVRVLGADVSLSLELDPHLAAMSAQPAAVRQVIMNLATNARDAVAGGGTGHVLIATRNHRIEDSKHASLPAGDYVMIVVQDDGQGMTPDVEARVFEPFFTTKSGAPGAGLGLSAAYAEVRSAGGDIAVETEPGAGSVFTVLLPASDKPPTWTPDDRVVTEQLGGSETILVAEDDPGVRSLIIATLERHGYSVMSAVDGRQALDLFRTYGHLLDLVVTDVNMPGLTGPELARIIADTDATMPILYVSGFTADAFLSGESEHSLFLPKPFTPVQLAQSVSRALASRR